MTDFLPEHPYSKFLKQPLELWMFVPCDEDGNVIPELYNDEQHVIIQHLEYQEAKERCLFDDYSLEYSESLVEYWKKIEDLVQYNLRLTPTALKQIGV